MARSARATRRTTAIASEYNLTLPTMKPLKIETAFRTPWFELVAKTMRAGEPPFYSLRLADYAAILAITEEQRVLAVRQYRPAVERYTIELPAGLLDDPTETPAQAAGRELIEETGYEAARMEMLGPLTTDTGRLGNRLWGCLATGCRPIGGREPEQGIEVLLYTIPELLRAIQDGSFDHALHLAVIMQAIAGGRLQ